MLNYAQFMISIVLAINVCMFYAKPDRQVGELSVINMEPGI